ncbi:MAG: PLP-dependent aminotransferase family protein [Candidatus Omnitrophota bacterium]
MNQRHAYAINSRLYDAYLERMNFLNEISIIYPHAISFGSGRPDQDYFHVSDVLTCFHTFADLTNTQGGNKDAFYNALGQYNKTKGIINDAIAKLLFNDEQISVHPEDIILTDGAQEGMAIVINSLFETPDDVLLVSDPSYIGFVGYAKIYGVPIVAVRRDEDSIDLDRLEATIIQLKREGKNPKVLYDVPDFHNPSTAYMPLEKRKRLIELAEKYNFLIVEDNPYGYFIYDTEKIPTLKALDPYRRVIHLGCFSKTIFPAIRMGYLIVDQEFSDRNRAIKLVEEFKKTKSFITVNTSPILQAMTAGLLHQHRYSLIKSCNERVSAYKQKRDAMMEALAHYFPSSESWTEGISWKKPQGGFFLAVTIPFEMSDRLLGECVKDYSVIFCPMSYFCLDESVGAYQIRLAFSNLYPDVIEKGISQLAAFIKKQLAV